jgi:biotin carboxyl carrier protein
MTPVGLPDELWSDVEEGTEALVEEWLVKVGDTVTAGQALGSVVFVKSSHEIVAPVAGTVQRICVQIEETFARGKTLIELA